MKKQKFNKKKLLMVGLPLLAVVIVSAAIITYYALYIGVFDVSQSIQVSGEEYFSFNGKSYTAGESFFDCEHSVKNVANVNVPIKFGTTCANSEGFDDETRSESNIDWSTFSNNRCDGIITSIYGILELSTKDTDTWAVDGTKAKVKYTVVSDTFSAEVIEGAIEDYELIYYKDAEDAQTVAERTASPQKAIKISAIGSNSLPYANDGNVQADANYCGNPDNYEHCKGTKLWYVPSEALSNCVNGVCDINWGLWGNFLYETDLIVYSSDAGNKITLPSNGGGFKYCVQNDLVTNLQPDTYTITTKVLPA